MHCPQYLFTPDSFIVLLTPCDITSSRIGHIVYIQCAPMRPPYTGCPSWNLVTPHDPETLANPVSHFDNMLLFKICQFHHVAFPEQDRLQYTPDLTVASCLAEYISRVGNSGNVNELEDLHCDGFSHSMKREEDMSFVKTCMRNTATPHNRLVIAKHVGWATDFHSKVSQHLLVDP